MRDKSDVIVIRNTFSLTVWVYLIVFLLSLIIAFIYFQTLVIPIAIICFIYLMYLARLFYDQVLGAPRKYAFSEEKVLLEYKDRQEELSWSDVTAMFAYAPRWQGWRYFLKIKEKWIYLPLFLPIDTIDTLIPKWGNLKLDTSHAVSDHHYKRWSKQGDPNPDFTPLEKTWRHANQPRTKKFVVTLIMLGLLIWVLLTASLFVR